ncbi:hypothetical protein KRP22_013140 [Phytophthora ramorum]|nr:hypothetical protein KRP22_11074 [Phytophthora ramorum]
MTSAISFQCWAGIHTALPTAKLAYEAVKTLCGGQEGSDKVFLVGHSFGAHTVINMATLHAAERECSALKVRGMALLAPAGWNPVVSALLPPFIKAVYTKLLGFPSDLPSGHYMAGLIRAGTTDFGVIREQVNALRELKLPSLVAWSQNDEFMEEDIPIELARLCYPGPRLAFASGAHNVQKTRAEQIAEAVSKWIEEVSADENEGEQQPTQQLP